MTLKMLIDIGKVCVKGFFGTVFPPVLGWRLKSWTPDPHPDPQAKRPSAPRAVVKLCIKLFMAHVNIVAVL